ncbi:MAG: tetratricopeptide repeat protein [Sedimentisphaerales bacterium]|nr:tetratricopeptide repeat protein [Sedimentisphaerales bacterium]
MKKWLLFIAAFVLINAGLSTFLSAQNYNNQGLANQNITSSGYFAGRSNIQSGYNSGNTASGNLRTGSQTQGQTPYRTNSSYNANPGAYALNSFMRNSSGSDSLSKYLTNNTSNSMGTNYQSYTLPYQTMATMPGNANNLQTKSNESVLLSRQNTSNITSSEQIYNNHTTQPQNQQNNSYIQTNLSTRTDSTEISRSLAAISEQLNTLQRKMETGNNSNNTDASNSIKRYMTNSKANEVTSTSDLYSGIDENSSSDFLKNNTNLNSFQSGISSSSARINQPQYQAGNLTGSQPQQSSYDSLDQIKAKLDELSRSIDSHLQSNSVSSGQYETKNPSYRSQEQVSTFQSYSKSQFDKYFNTAQQQLRQGNYYEAADSFMLACVYEPDNPLCYAGQGHALFATGQFVNSALFIIRAIELNPEYIQSNIDFAAITGGRDMTGGRITELEQLLKKAPASGLQFLMAYVYYRTGRLSEARQIINTIYQDMPNSRAALALKIAVDTKLNSQQ